MPTIEPTTVMPLSTVWKIGSGSHDGDIGATGLANLVGRRTGRGVDDVVGSELFGQSQLVLGHVGGQGRSPRRCGRTGRPGDRARRRRTRQRDRDAVPQSLYMVMSNAEAVSSLVRLFELWQQDPSITFDTGLNPLKQVFDLLRAVRRWGPEIGFEKRGYSRTGSTMSRSSVPWRCACRDRALVPRRRQPPDSRAGRRRAGDRSRGRPDRTDFDHPRDAVLWRSGGHPL